MLSTGFLDYCVSVFLINAVSGSNHKKWIENDGIWYFMSQDTFDFTGAIQYCLEEDAHIAIVADERQDKFLKQNKFKGWIGLTNTPSLYYNNAITHGVNTTNRPSFRDHWYWTVNEWKLFNGSRNDPTKYFVNLTDEAAHAKNNSAVVIGGDKLWSILDFSSKYKAICEWQCNTLDIVSNLSNADVSGNYLKRGYLNQRRYYEKENTNGFLYFMNSNSAIIWVIHTDLVSTGPEYFLRNSSMSPIDSSAMWMSMDSSLDINLTCIIPIAQNNRNVRYNKTNYKCKGFTVFIESENKHYLYLHRITNIPYWCIGMSVCDESPLKCNRYPTPLLNNILLNHIPHDWVPPYQIGTNQTYDVTSSESPPPANNKASIYIGIGCGIGVLLIIITITLIVIVITKRKASQQMAKTLQSTHEKSKPEFTDYSYICARDVIKQNGTNNNIAMNKLDYLGTENENSHMYSLEKIPQVKTTHVNDDISKQNEYSPDINNKCDTYEDIENLHDQNLTDSDKATAQGLVNNSPKPLKPPRTFAHESVYSEEESPPPPVPSKGILDSCTKTVFDNVVFEKDEGHDIELFENTIYETNVTK